MDQNNFIYKKDAYEGFVETRNLLNDVIQNPNKYKKNFDEAFADVGSLAMAGNPIAQDILSYYYKIGVKNSIEENYDLFMQWSILAGANGNEFALEKLQFFLNYAFYEVISSEDLEKILQRNDITQQNYIYVLGNLICEGLVDEMQISAEKLVKTPNTTVNYSPQKLRSYKKKIDSALPKILEYLLS